MFCNKFLLGKNIHHVLKLISCTLWIILSKDDATQWCPGNLGKNWPICRSRAMPTWELPMLPVWHSTPQPDATERIDAVGWFSEVFFRIIHCEMQALATICHHPQVCQRKSPVDKGGSQEWDVGTRNIWVLAVLTTRNGEHSQLFMQNPHTCYCS